MRRRLTALLLCLALCLLPAPQAGAHDAGEHWKEIRYVLFGQERTPSSLDKDQRQKLNDLLYATQLCIDQLVVPAPHIYHPCIITIIDIYPRA